VVADDAARAAAFTALLDRLEAEPWALDFYALMRRVEGLHPERPRLGDATRPADEALRLGQMPSLIFEPATLAGLSRRDGRVPRLYVQVAGLWGPQGPMPLHLTELARERERNLGDATLARFADVFHHRLLTYFYRAWRQAQPAASADRPAEDRFRLYVGALIGQGGAPWFDADDVSLEAAQRHHAGQLGRSVRGADAVTDVLADYFGVPVEVEQFVPDWLEMPLDGRTRLGARDGSATLGTGAVLGARVRDCQHQIELRIGPMNWARYHDFLPGGRSLPRLRELMRTLTHDEWRWRARLLLAPDAIRPAALDGGARLGGSAWLPKAVRRTPADDLRLAPESLDRTP
jgi:type VI secretion system protein ImpH